MSDIAKIHDIEWYSEVPRSIRKQMTAGLILLGATFGGFGAWAFTAPLAAAVIAQGSFVAINNTVSQSVPHLHLHVVPRTKGDGLRGFFWPRTTYAAGEPETYADRLRAALDEG